jgi:hypothetical protein
MGPELMRLLSIRDAARDGQLLDGDVRPEADDEREAYEIFRIDMTFIELVVHSYVDAEWRGQPSPSSQEALFDHLIALVEELVEYGPVLARFQRHG